MIRIGITGPIGCGKSTVAGWLTELGAAVVNADRVARDVVEPGQPAHEAVVEAFGPGIVAADGSIDRAALGQIVFADEMELARLEAIVHPAVRPRILAAIDDAERSGAAAVVVEAIKLVESGLAALCDEVWLIVCHPEAQRARLKERGLDANSARQRIDAQQDPARRLADAAIRVIDTSADFDATRASVAEAWRAALR